MKLAGMILCLVLSMGRTFSQSENAAEQVIEGSKVVVELIKALKGKGEKSSGCKGLFADLCISNESNSTIHVFLFHRTSVEKREMVIQPKMRECSLQIPIGVWTYELRSEQNTLIIRKGDLLIEDCQNLMMNIKY